MLFSEATIKNYFTWELMHQDHCSRVLNESTFKNDRGDAQKGFVECGMICVWPKFSFVAFVLQRVWRDQWWKLSHVHFYSNNSRNFSSVNIKRPLYELIMMIIVIITRKKNCKVIYTKVSFLVKIINEWTSKKKGFKYSYKTKDS